MPFHVFCPNVMQMILGISARSDSRKARLGLALTLCCGLGFAAGAWVGPVSSAPGFQAGGGARRVAPPTMSAPVAGYPADFVRVLDGDTFEARVRIWPGVEVTTKVRLRGIDAPELGASCERERRQARAARDALGRLLEQGRIALTEVSNDKYGGRVLAAASAHGTPDLATAMLASGLARPYSGGRRRRSCD